MPQREFDITIGADSALHRITEALDAITSTAASRGSTRMRSGGMFMVTRASTSW